MFIFKFYTQPLAKVRLLYSRSFQTGRTETILGEAFSTVISFLILILTLTPSCGPSAESRESWVLEMNSLYQYFTDLTYLIVTGTLWDGQAICSFYNFIDEKIKLLKSYWFKFVRADKCDEVVGLEFGFSVILSHILPHIFTAPHTVLSSYFSFLMCKNLKMAEKGDGKERNGVWRPNDNGVVTSALLGFDC